MLLSDDLMDRVKDRVEIGDTQGALQVINENQGDKMHWAAWLRLLIMDTDDPEQKSIYRQLAAAEALSQGDPVGARGMLIEDISREDTPDIYRQMSQDKLALLESEFPPEP